MMKLLHVNETFFFIRYVRLWKNLGTPAYTRESKPHYKLYYPSEIDNCCILLSNFFLFQTNILLYQVDIWNLKFMFLLLEWIGMNAMFVYVMAAEDIFAGFINGWYYGDPHNTLVRCVDMILYVYIYAYSFKLHEE